MATFSLTPAWIMLRTALPLRSWNSSVGLPIAVTALTADATEPAWNGYLLTVACPCGVVFERWVTPEEADRDLLRPASLN
jgi:hypothetical protein